MLVGNSTAILLLGIITGAVTNLNFIGSLAYLLSLLDPVYALYVITLSGVAFVIFLRLLGDYSGNFARFSLVSIGIFAAITGALNFEAIPPVVRALAWFFMAMNGIAYFRWVISEFTCRYLDPARTKSYFVHIVSADELGILLASVLFRLYEKSFDSTTIIWLSVVVFIVTLLIVHFQFSQPTNVEIHYRGKGEEDTSHKDDSPLLGKFVFLLLVLSLTLGTTRVCEEHLIKVALKEGLGSYNAISIMMANYLIISSVVIIVVSTLLGKIIKSKHISPIVMMGIHTIVCLLAAVSCLIFGGLYYFVSFEIIKRTFERCFNVPSQQIIFSCFVKGLRNRLRAAQNFYYYTVIPIPYAIFFSIPAINKSAYQKEIILAIIIASLIGTLYFLAKFRDSFRDTLCKFALSLNKSTAVMAVQALSFLKPKKYERFLVDILKISPKKILRKNIILSLAYAHKSEVDDVIIKEFASEKEEIQLAVLDALNVSRGYKAIQFMINIIKVLEKPKSLRVRINATTIVAGMYGRKAIPFLLDGLEDPDSRVVANTLETLSVYKDRELIPYFLKFISSDVPRVKANALIGLSYFRRTNDVYHKEMIKVLNGKNARELASILYAVGFRKDKFFTKRLLALFNSTWRDNETVKRSLAWALVRIGCQEGYVLFDELLAEEVASDTEPAITHHLSLMDTEMRFDVLKHFAARCGRNRDLVGKVCQRLKQSKFDFHQELEYFQSIATEYAKVALVEG